MVPPFVHRLRVRYSECDAQGAVFNANYLTYFDVALTELWREAIGPYGEMTAGGVDMVVAEARVRYLVPVRFDDEIDVGIAVVRLGTTGLTTRPTIDRGGERVAEGLLRHVFVDTRTAAKAEIPPAIRRALEPYLVPDAAPVESAR